MSFFGKSTANDSKNDAKLELERQAIERLKGMVRETLQKMRDASPSDAERFHQQIKDYAKEKSLPMEFKRKALEYARAYECNANMRNTDRLLHEAIRLAAAEQMKERGQKLAEARKLYGKACSLGADLDFRKAAQRLMDTIMLTGGVVHPGPSRAKPADTAPRAPNRAKC
ncbi:hypothetical protein [Telmatospirillum sp.]|uniref:hypothetical protein n=1 Tax=Telmatospirillum sp. TaxID=2079197 RepID=UPI00284187A0|nr:hypothetical protein [Telmatospirillum sp.]MDR3435472.1 hypothetical protein [Telmatospirillum sp.]